MPLTIQEALKQRWYYSFELKDKRYTLSPKYKNMSVTRRLLETLSVQDRECLDISTMEGMVSTLLSKRGAKVTATDTIDLTERVNLIKSLHDVNYTYMPHVPVDRYVDHVLNYQVSSKHSEISGQLSYETTSPYGFDLIIASGLIYHVHNPIDHILSYRKLLKKGGYLLLETAAVLHDEVELIHDYRNNQQIWGGKATWYPTTKFLEVYLKALHFRPVSFAYIRSQGKTDLPLCRIAVLAEAIETPGFSNEEYTLLKDSELYTNYDLKPLNFYARVCGVSENPPIVSDKVVEGVHRAATLKGASISKLSPVEYDDTYLSLALSDT